MATTPALMDQQITNPSLQQDNDHRHQIRRGSARRKPKGSDSAKKKEPQRGMGVERLERIRMEAEKLKKMAENTTNNQLGYSINNNVASFSDPTGYGGVGGQMGLNQNQSFPGQMGVVGAGLGSSDQLQTDLFRMGYLNIHPDFLGTSNVVHYYSQHCNACHKKKKVNGENTVKSDMYKNIDDCGFLGRATKTAPDVEVDAVERKGSSSDEGGSVLTEYYEFFPTGKGRRRRSCSHNDELLMVGTSTETSTAAASSNCIDLSLKLSY